MGYDSTSYLPRGVTQERVTDLLLLLGYQRYTFREPDGTRPVVFHYFKDDDYRSFCGVRVTINDGANGVEATTRTNSWCSEDDMRVQNLTLRRVREYLGGHFVTDFGKNRFFQFEGERLQPAEAGCYLAFSNFGHNMVRMAIYAEHREFKGEQWKTTGQFSFMDAINPRIVSNNALVPFMVAALEEYFQATFVALLKYSDNKLSILKNSRIRAEDLLGIAGGKTSVERAVSDQFSFQNLEQIVSHFRAIDKRLDVAGVLRRPYRRRKLSLYESLGSLIKHRHDNSSRPDFNGIHRRCCPQGARRFGSCCHPRLSNDHNHLQVALYSRLGQWHKAHQKTNGMKTLGRQKLEVVNQTRSNLFGWRGQFTPDSPMLTGFCNLCRVNTSE